MNAECFDLCVKVTPNIPAVFGRDRKIDAQKSRKNCKCGNEDMIATGGEMEEKILLGPRTICDSITYFVKYRSS